MDTRTKFLRPDVRDTVIYTRATIIFTEKREMLSKLSLLNQELRELQHQDADAVAAARIDIPFRNSPGRKKSV
jgi:hypothetical protein